MLATCAGCVNLFAIDSIDTSVRSVRSVINVINVIFGRSQDVEEIIFSIVSTFVFFYVGNLSLLSFS